MEKLIQLWNAVKGWKTYIIAGTMILYAIIIVGWQGGDWKTAGEIILSALGLSSVRHALK